MSITILLAAALATPAVDDANASDAQCLAWFLMLGNNPEQYWDSGLAKSGALLFAGRLTGRNPTIDLKAAILQAAPAAKSLSRVEGSRCMAFLDPIAVALHDGGDAIIKP